MRNEPPALSERSESNGLDALIDSAAREMMAAEPSASLRSGVRERIGGRRPVWSLVPAWGVAVGVAIAALIVGRALSGPPGERDNVRPTIERVANPVQQPPVVELDTRSVRLPWLAEARDERRRQADQTPTVRLTRRLADDVAALPDEEEPPIPPIAIEPLVTIQIAVGNAIAVESSGVMPIEIEPLQIEPLRGIE